MKVHNVAIVGCGTVGGATAQLLTRDRDILKERTGLNLNLKYIVSKTYKHARELNLDSSLFESDLDKVLDDPDVEIVAELVGGITLAKEIIEKSIKAGKHIVTANKALLAHYGAELLSMARDRGVALSFEASCAGGVPIVRALYDGLIANRIDAIYGIVNGTCNYILTEMTQIGRSYKEALKDAQNKGLAEADPFLDVSGTDTAHKLAILAAIAFSQKIDFDKIPVTGIDTLDIIDVSFGQELGYIIKLLAIAQRMERGISLRVHPAFIAKDHPLAWISGPFNAVSVYGHAVGHTMYYGRGAGGSPTASAVVSDIVSAALGTASLVFHKLKVWPHNNHPAVQLPPEEVRSRYYIRLMAEDKPGVFAKIADVLGRHLISISSVLQKEPHEPGANPLFVPVVITTHTAQAGNVSSAIEELDSLDVISGKSVCIAILDEHEETI
ncbi:MAG: homoserine dehydrogenase [Spirochaetes bacterium]|nr:MAG: homoserine dehydrogenase [Spirochaetota bacterium]